MRVCGRCRSIYHHGTKHCGIDGQELIDFVDDPLIGQQIDRYRITELIGRGGCGSVYKAVHSQLKTEFALKVLYGDLGADARYIERFRREAQAVSKIRSPWVVSVVDFGTSEGGLTYLVMEYCTGQMLDHMISREKTVEPGRAARITAHVASALAIAHKAGLIHRDVKPANIVVDVVEGREYAKLLDFGIVRLTTADASERLTQEGAVIGTPPYMSPEQGTGDQATPQSDLYSLGVVLYQMLAGKKPFTGSAGEVLRKHCNEPPPPLSFGGPIADLTYALLEKNPASRPANAAQVAERAKRIEVELRGGKETIDLQASDAPTARSGAAPNPTIVISQPGNESTRAGAALAELSNVHPAPSSSRRWWWLAAPLALAGIAALWLVPPPGPDVVTSAPTVEQKTAGGGLVELEKELTQTLSNRGLDLSDLSALPGAKDRVDRWQRERQKSPDELTGTLTELTDIARKSPITDELLTAHLDRLDPIVARLGEKLSGAEFDQIKVDYLDLYRQVRLAQTDSEREVMSQAIGRFEQRISEKH